MAENSILLMSPPDFYRIREPGKNGHPNLFSIKGYEEYISDKPAFRAKAVTQWNKLKDIFIEAGAEVILMPAREENPPLTFTADPFISLTDGDKVTTIISKFSNTRRLDEPKIAERFFRESFPERELVKSELFIEGTGDNVYDPFRDIFWSGYDPHGATTDNASTGRSDINAHKMLNDVTGVEVVSLAVKSPFFHIDTALCPLPNGHMLFCKNGLQDDAIENFMSHAFTKHKLDPQEFLIEVNNEDALAFGCNARTITNSKGEQTIVMAKISEELKRTIASKGYKVITTDLSVFIANGGAAHCLSNNLNEIRNKK